jgi:DNA-directed RNA polymerase specialized sigma24 family protein
MLGNDVEELAAGEQTPLPKWRAASDYDLTRLLSVCPERFHRTLLLRFAHSMSYADIARELNISTNTVASRLNRSLAIMRACVRLL